MTACRHYEGWNRNKKINSKSFSITVKCVYLQRTLGFKIACKKKMKFVSHFSGKE
jgi:hypothetical protein